MYACLSKQGADFSRGCTHPATRPPISTPHPHSSTREFNLRKRSIRTLAWLLRGHVICRPFEAVSERNHSETWAGCIVSLTASTSSSFSASRSRCAAWPKGFEGLPGVVLAAVEAPVYEALYETPQGVEQHGDRQRRGDHAHCDSPPVSALKTYCEPTTPPK